MKGHLILIVGPSGSGKSSVLSHVRETFPDAKFAVSCTTRLPRPGEVEGDTYHFLSESDFKKHIEDEVFLEWASYGGNLYGTLKSEILDPVKEGQVVIREVEVQGAREIQGLVPKENLTVIFLDAGSWETLVDRITARAPIGETELEKRRMRYDDERSFISEADVVVENHEGGLEQAKEAVERVVAEIIQKVA